ncbi:MAG: hypothetical protein WDN46_14045 [Methylocella sp.]
MSDRPIPFSAPMIRALLDGRKTQTRRIIKPQPLAEAVADGSFMRDANALISPRPIRWSVGDHLWVREAHYLTDNGHNELAVYAEDQESARQHLEHVDSLNARYPTIDWSRHGKLRPFIHMPRWASRLTLIVSDVRVQRLQDISETEAIAEGIAQSPHGNRDQWCNYPLGSSAAGWIDPRSSFESLWRTINGTAAWDANPWVVALTFSVHRANIDAMPALENGLGLIHE